ncbi:MAG: hypothetical protein RI897_2494 [Verrucomicrobiota bacterium]
MLLLLEFDGGHGGVGEAAPAFEAMHFEGESGGFTAGEGGGPFLGGFVGALGFDTENESAVFVVPVSLADGAAVIDAHIGGKFCAGFHDGIAFGFHTAGFEGEHDDVLVEFPVEAELDGVAGIGGAFPAAEHPAGVGFIGEAGQGDLGLRGQSKRAGQSGDRDES